MIRAFLFLSVIATGYWGYQLDQSNRVQGAEINRLEGKLSGVEHTLTLRVKQRDRYRSTANKYQEQLEKTQQEVEGLRKELVSVNRQLDSSKAAFTALSGQEGDLKTRLATLQGDFVGVQQSNHRLVERIYTAHALLAQADLEFLDSQAQVDQYVVDQQKNSEQMALLEQSYSEMEQSYAEMAQSRSEIEQVLERREQESVELKEQIASLDGELLKTKNSLTLLKKESDARRKNVVKKGSSKQSEVTVLIQERERLIDTNQALVRQLTEVKNQRAELKDINSDLEQKLLGLSYKLRQSQMEEVAHYR